MFNTKSTETMDCPMCGDAQLKHSEQKGTHIYKCPNCPLVALEFYRDADAENLKNHLTK